MAICDDDQQQRELVQQMLLTLSMKTSIDFEMELFEAGEALVSHYQNDKEPFHILILDIEMNGLNGIQTAQQIRDLKRLDEQIVFLTSYPDYMIESFDVVTFQYLLKPIAVATFEEKILKLFQYFQSLDKRILIIKSDYEEVVLKYDDIISIEAVKSLTMKNKLHVVTLQQTHTTKGIISNYATALKQYHFLQIHRSIIINLLHVKKFAGGMVLMSNEVELPIGRSKVKEVKDVYTKFMITGMYE